MICEGCKVEVRVSGALHAVTVIHSAGMPLISTKYRWQRSPHRPRLPSTTHSFNMIYLFIIIIIRESSILEVSSYTVLLRQPRGLRISAGVLGLTLNGLARNRLTQSVRNPIKTLEHPQEGQTQHAWSEFWMGFFKSEYLNYLDEFPRNKLPIGCAYLWGCENSSKMFIVLDLKNPIQTPTMCAVRSVPKVSQILPACIYDAHTHVYIAYISFSCKRV